MWVVADYQGSFRFEEVCSWSIAPDRALLLAGLQLRVRHNDDPLATIILQKHSMILAEPVLGSGSPVEDSRPLVHRMRLAYSLPQLRCT